MYAAAEKAMRKTMTSKKSHHQKLRWC